MKIKKALFLTSCTSSSHYPETDYPEFAFFGRSNVGKSSLINMLLGQKNLVKTGSRPGVTKMINFFIVNDSISIVDLPGFGYSKLPLTIKKQFPVIIKKYIENRKNLRLAFLLIDIRRIPGDMEKSYMELLTKNKIPVAVTLTKSDKLSANQAKKSITSITSALGIDRDSIFISSSQTKEGRKELISLMDEFIKN